ncbi:MAG: DNA ligase D, partial [Gammaproteobacteria bacterium]
LFTRRGNDWTDRLEPLAAAIEALGVRTAWLDGEIVVLDEAGIPDFGALQNSFDSARADDIVYFLFDLPWFEGYDLRKVPLHLRRALLRQLIEGRDAGPLRFSADFVAEPADILRSACQMKLEGIIAKRADAPYVSQRTETWLKLKCQARQEFVIVGFTDRTGAAGQVGSLVLGYHDESGKLRSAGSVGTGWSSETAADLHRRLAKLEVPDSPFEVAPRAGRWARIRGAPARTEHWVKPRLVAEISFSEWTRDGHIRHASFVGLRTDKPAGAITREKASAVAGAEGGTGRKVGSNRSSASKVGAIKVSNPDRVIDPSTGLKKLDLVRYYESIAERMLPHLKGRPVSLVRGPSGIDGQLFFQKHDDKLSIPGMRALDPALWPGHEALLEVPTQEALVSAAQMNVIEFHTWNARADRIDKPDRVVFDLDPGEGVAWKQLQEAALLTRSLLQDLGLESWLKTSGGKGLHVVVPLKPKLDWDTVKDFSRAIVTHLAKTIPDRFSAKSGA